MSQYPEAFCVSCRQHTDTQNRHTVVLANQSRALKGYCPKCKNQVYKIMPKKTKPNVSLGKAEAPIRQFHYKTSLTTKGVTAMATCPSCHADQPALFLRAIRNPMGNPVLLGRCNVCKGDVRRTVDFIPPVLQNPRQGRRLSISFAHAALAFGLLVLGLYAHQIGVF